MCPVEVLFMSQVDNGICPHRSAKQGIERFIWKDLPGRSGPRSEFPILEPPMIQVNASSKAHKIVSQLHDVLTLPSRVENLASKYREAKPFPHIVIDNMF